MSSFRVAMWAMALYFAVVSAGLAYLHLGSDTPVSSADMVAQSWFIQLILTVLCLYYVVRHFGWAGVGFGKTNWLALLWLLPAYLVLAAVLVVLWPSLQPDMLTPSQRQTLILLGLTAALIGFSEEVMFRGIVLRGALQRMGVVPAMLLSAVTFSAVHALNGFGLQPSVDGFQQLAFTFLIGFFLAPVALTIGSLWPLIIWHWLWDFAVFSSTMLDVIQPFALTGILAQVVIGLWLWGKVVRENRNIAIAL